MAAPYARDNRVMKPSTAIILVVLLGAGASGLYFLGKPPVNTARKEDEAKAALQAEELPIALLGPYPHVVVDPPAYDFGVHERGDTGVFSFTIRNEGDGDLLLKNGKGDCSCTVGELSTTGPLKKGEEAKVVVNWKINESQAEMFRHSVMVYTNDPEEKQLHLYVRGRVAGEKFTVLPARLWQFGEFNLTEPAKMDGAIVSIADTFTVKNIAATKPSYKITWEPFSAEELEPDKLKAAYHIHVDTGETTAVGNFMDQFTIELVNSKGEEVTQRFGASGVRLGPIRIVGTGFSESDGVLRLGNVNRVAGKKVQLGVFVQNMEADLEVQQAEIKHNSVTYSLTKDEKFKSAVPTTKRYLLNIEIPADGPTAEHRGKDAERITLKVNHPQVESINLAIDYNAN